MTEPLILLSAGGTGGHVFPARALAEELIHRGFRVAFVTDARGVKYLDNIPEEFIHVINLAPNGSNIFHKMKLHFSLIQAYGKSRKLIKKLKPAAAVGFGGYPSAPPMYAAQRLGVPTILHEQNAILGLAHRLLASGAKVIALSHKDTKRMKPGWSKKSKLTGNPVRSDIMQLRHLPFPSIGGALNILIFGGSLGAASFAYVIPQAVIKVAHDLKKDFVLRIVHQARDSDIAKVEGDYQKAGLSVQVKSFFDNIPQLMAETHLMICRSGASTIAEVTCAGRPAVYIPYPWHKDKQQLHNANTVASVGGGWIVEERELTPDRLHDLLKGIIPNKLEAAAEKAKALGEPEAAAKLASIVEDNASALPKRMAVAHHK